MQRYPCSRSQTIVLVAVILAAAGLARVNAALAEPFEQKLHGLTQNMPPARAITHGPKYHWFGYYDKFQFDATDRYVLSMQVDFEHRSPRPDDVITIGMIDLRDNNRWIELGESRAWCWQQGCMLQWRPGSDSEVMWNDREGDQFVCRVLNVKTGKRRTLPRPIHHVSPDGKWALVTDVARVGEMRRGYGYNGIPDPNRNVAAPKDSGLWKMNLDTGEVTMLFSLADIAEKFPLGHKNPQKHYFNHIQWSPDGSRFLFLNRGRGVGTRMFTAAADGSDLRMVNLNSSHYAWRDPKTILVWVGDYVLVNDDSSLKCEVLLRAPNGHESYLPNQDWIVTDTYPLGAKREQIPYLYHIPTKKMVPLGFFPSPKQYEGEWRCDTHPRLSRDGRTLCIDSPHGGNGRQLYLIDIGAILDAPIDGESASEPIVLPDWTPPGENGRTEPFVLDPDLEDGFIWGRGRSEPTHYFDEFLPGLFKRTVKLDEWKPSDGAIEWIFTGDEGGVTLTLSDGTLQVARRYYGSPGFAEIPGAMGQRYAQLKPDGKTIRFKGRLEAVSIALDHKLKLRVALNGREVFAETCAIDLSRHQIRLTGRGGRVTGACFEPGPVDCTVSVDPSKRHQTMIGFGGITTPTAYRQLSTKGKRQWWELLCEYNLLIHREYPIGTRLNAECDNWERLDDAMPHYYGDNFPNGEISDFDYIRTIRRLDGKVLFEFWRLPPWVNQTWTDSDGKVHRGVVNPPKYVEAMLAYCRASKARAGAPPDVVGVQNEIRQPVPLWNEMIVELRKGLDEAGFGDVKIHMTDSAVLRVGCRWLKDLRTLPDAWAVTDYVATHMYEYQDFFGDPDGFDPLLRNWHELSGGKPFLSTELCTNYRDYMWDSYRLALSMGQLYQKNLVISDASAICYCWTLLNVVQPPFGWTRSLVVPDPADDFTPKASSHQLRVFGAFSRRVREGMVRVDADSGDVDVLTCAFAGPKGRATLIIMNRSDAPRRIRVNWPTASFTEAETVGPYHANEPFDLANSKNDFSHVLAPGEILTLTNVPLGRLPNGFESVENDSEAPGTEQR